MSLGLLTRFGMRPPAAGGGGGGCDTVGLTLTGSPGGFNTTLQLGWEFVPASDIGVCKLRVYCNENESMTLRLWRSSDQSLLDSVTVAGVVNTWVEGTLASPITLSGGANYVVSVRGNVGTWHCYNPSPGAFSIDAALTFVVGRFGTDDGWPANTGGGVYAGGIADIVF